MSKQTKLVSVFMICVLVIVSLCSCAKDNTKNEKEILDTVGNFRKLFATYDIDAMDKYVKSDSEAYSIIQSMYEEDVFESSDKYSINEKSAEEFKKMLFSCYEFKVTGIDTDKKSDAKVYANLSYPQIEKMQLEKVVGEYLTEYITHKGTTRKELEEMVKTMSADEIKLWQNNFINEAFTWMTPQIITGLEKCEKDITIVLEKTNDKWFIIKIDGITL